ncbi:YeeE/YedE family protein [Clostridium tetani]|uniref:YeeE/YedE family protein n=3 Tax=Clostridium tetani TaxID=1513 RepID=A0ABY0EM18_CLOTA|nr:YeeE/YedE family protein [Clostridium tetani]RXI67355.1 YeeE/YedE family protein [Clostridium tetani]CDI49263.1 transporter [Clostridium tetani 12124569]
MPLLYEIIMRIGSEQGIMSKKETSGLELAENTSKVELVSTDKKQTYIGLALLIALSIFGSFQYAKDSKLALFLITGLAVGYVMQRSRFGFAGGVKKIYVTGDGTLTKALMFLFAITLLITAAIHYGAFMAGAKIPGASSVKPTNLGTVIGGVLFGIGMMFGGGCASGTLTDSGEGEIRAFIVLFFFVTGSLIGVKHMPWWEQSIFFKLGGKVYLPDTFGYLGSIIVSLLGFLLIYVITMKYEAKRKRENTYTKEEYSDWEKPLPETTDYKFLSERTYHKFFIQRWSFYTGAVCLTIMFIAILVTTGKSWGVTSTFADWGAWLYQSVGIVDVSNWPWFASRMKKINGGFLNDPSSMRNIGILLGATLSLLLARRFSFKKNFKFRDVVFYAIGGLIMGYGARVGLGCNAGALYSAICNFSLSGWVFLPAMTVGGIIGVNLVKKFNVTI